MCLGTLTIKTKESKMEKIKSMWDGLSKKGKIGTVAIIAIVVVIIWGQIF
jgi:flagellar biosynthesis/type III secretory pathway M-ring protein FliF/YscJ